MLISLDRSVITIDRVRKFARKLCGYKLAYSLLVYEAAEEDTTTTTDEIEHILKHFNVHISVMDADYQFISRA